MINPVSAIYNGLEILDEDDNAEAKTYALDVIRNVTERASARLQFARFAFGAAGSAGAEIRLSTAEQVSRGLMAQEQQHKLVWRAIPGKWPRTGQLLLNLVASAVTALPRDGQIEVVNLGQPGQAELRVALPRHGGAPTAVPQRLRRRRPAPQLDAMSIRPTTRGAWPRPRRCGSTSPRTAPTWCCPPSPWPERSTTAFPYSDRARQL
jgi:histidine phosphotransferase ChpT